MQDRLVSGRRLATPDRPYEGTGGQHAERRYVVGLYLDAPERAVVLCVDEKSQIQALARFGPILPMLLCRRPTRPH